MFEARIVSAAGSFYFASTPTAQDLQSLRAHVRDLAGVTRDVRVDVSADDAEWTDLVVSGWLDRLARAGASVHRCPPR